MPRPPRLLLSKSYYHIITRGNNRNTVFRENMDYQYFLGLIAKYKLDLPFNLYHYCLMPNHVHFLIQTEEAHEFSKFMKKLNLSYFYYYKKTYRWMGHFWQDRFKSQPVGKDEYFIQCGKYIELNPVRANMVQKPEEYAYSSYNYYAQGKDDNLLTEDMFYQELGNKISERQKKYQELVVSEIVDTNYRSRVWGSPKQRYNEAKKINNHLNQRLKIH